MKTILNMKLEKIFQRSLGISPNENVLIITDKLKLPIAKKVLTACKNISKNARIVVKPMGSRSGEEPPKGIAEMMKKYDVVIGLTTHSLTHTHARKNACKLGVRIATMPGFTEKMWGTLEADPYLLKEAGEKIREFLKDGKKMIVMTESGTSISFSKESRMVDIDEGLYTKKGNFGNLPAGEVSFARLENTANGVIVIDSMEDYAKPGTNVLVKDGKAVSISDKNCKLAKTFESVKNSRNIAELGIGTNPKAKLIGNILQDEKCKGTVHIAFGSNISYGGKVYSPFHLDAILLKPTVYVDDKCLMKNGKLLI